MTERQNEIDPDTDGENAVRVPLNPDEMQDLRDLAEANNRAVEDEAARGIRRYLYGNSRLIEAVRRTRKDPE
jgi:hypothetical protein